MSFTEFALAKSWLIVALPVVAFLNIAFVMIISGKSQRLARAISPWLLIGFLSIALVISIGALIGTVQHAPGVPEAAPGGVHIPTAAEQTRWVAFEKNIDWMVPQPMSGIDYTLKIGVLIDPLSAVMLFVVVLVSLLVQIYSYGYMKKEEHPRFYLYMSLFTASMLGLVIASTLLQLFIFWELVGLCSYFLIGFWYHKPEAARAAIKAFVVTRFGDLGLLFALIALWLGYGDLSFSNLYQQIIVMHNLAPAGLPFSLTIVAILIFIGASGKSAQFPLHIWLPDAMEGPTSVSALIHAATMVAAGVFLVARTLFIFETAPISLIVVAVVGAFTALFAATIALTQNDMKKVMAYSTISQLGYMMMGLGMAAPAAAFFHLTTHAFFKALLFLTAGSAIHGAHTQDMRQMGGMYGKMKITAITCAIGGLALAGIPIFAGYFSKHALLEAVLAAATNCGPKCLAIPNNLSWLVLGMALLTVLITAFYTMRMWVMVFLGKPRSDGAAHAHESPLSMTIPLIVLATLTVITGMKFIPFNVPRLVELVSAEAGIIAPALLTTLTVISLVLAVGGILWAYTTYVKAPAVEPLRKLGPFYVGSVNLWYVNTFFIWLAGRVVLAFGSIAARFDKGVVDGGFVDGTAWLTGRIGYKIRQWSAGPLPGQLQYYALVIFIIAALAVIVMSFQQYTGGAPAPVPTAAAHLLQTGVVR